MHIAFLYTLKANEDLFRPYIEKYLGDMAVTVAHYTDEVLLHQAMKEGLTDRVKAAVQQTISAIAANGADIIICTCSTIGDLAENTTGIRSKVIRVDRPMAEKAMKYDHILVLAALTSTLAPTTELLQSITSASEGEQQNVIEAVAILDVWPYYFSGNTEMYTRKIAAYIDSLQSHPQAVLLAQASMAPAAGYCTNSHVDILTSPELCLQYLAQQVCRDA
ncbi:hypothetical protein MD588_19585 [Photobacterium sp. SDRW27]|uniref:hypothetical protein n=1 Tax=Photobacterium obscurum TaxID=2829490 RepID=UPI002243FD72|nr:hypothetical protein [Photobacterium obscurum]MCW8331000.1 hypothetical protein [Photobacterium obscurum]